MQDALALAPSYEKAVASEEAKRRVARVHAMMIVAALRPTPLDPEVTLNPRP
jgi:hypothetical protein